MLITLSCKIYGQKTKLIFVDSLRLDYSENPIDSNKPFSFNLIKNKQYILKNNRADTLHHFCFDLDTLTAISFEFPSDTIFIPNVGRFFGDTVFGEIDLTPNYKTNCIAIEFISYTDPCETYQSIIPSDDGFTNPSCKDYKYVYTSFGVKDLNLVTNLNSYKKLK